MTKIEIWSDINCPFCYIGKRHLEAALKDFDKPVSVVWKSFELDPTANPDKGEDNADRLAKKYGKDRQWALEMNNNLTQMAAKAGLHFHMDKVVPSNSFNAHRLIHLAKFFDRQDMMKEKLLEAKFVKGKDINDNVTLKELGVEVGLEASRVEKMLESSEFSDEVRADEALARHRGIGGVPFFVFNSEFAMSGAQPVEAFKELLSRF